MPPTFARIPRRLQPVVLSRMQSTPVLLLEGPRSVGKSTLLSELAAPSAAEVFDFDEEDVLQTAQSNPTLLTDRIFPVFIDEYQKEPRSLGWIKARLNRGTQFGMFVLAGSASFDSLPSGIQSLTGRLQRLPVMPLTQTEIDGTSNRFLERAIDGEIRHTADPARTGRAEYIDRVVRGGMPLSLAQADDQSRRRWFRTHLRQALERDAGELRRINRNAPLPQTLNRLVGQTASLLSIRKVANDLGIAHDTARGYIHLLEALFLVSTLPAWRTTALARSVATPKIHVVDSGIGAHLLNISRAKLDRLDPSAMTEFGHLLESFVVQELLRQASWLDDVVDIGHWRTRDNDEVDLIVERDDGAIVGFEVKAADHVESKWLTPLQKLRDKLGSRFVAGIAFHLGKRGYQADDRIHVVPLDRLWV